MILSKREKQMVITGLAVMKTALERELAEVLGGLKEPDDIIRHYIEDRIDHYRVLIEGYERE